MLAHILIQDIGRKRLRYMIKKVILVKSIVGGVKTAIK